MAAGCVTGSPPVTMGRTFLLISAVVCFNAFGNLSLAWGMRHVAVMMGLDPLQYIRAMVNPFVAIGILLLILWLLTRMALLSWADLSFVIPLTSVGYVLAAVLGVWFLSETVTPGALAGHAADICRHVDGRGHSTEDGSEYQVKWVLLAVIVAATVLGDLLQSYEMKRSGEQSVDARGLGKLLRLIFPAALFVRGHCLHGDLVFRVHGLSAGCAVKFRGAGVRCHVRAGDHTGKSLY